VVGVSAVATQILVPFASHLAAALFGWRSVFYISADLMLALMLVLWRALPQRLPSTRLTYAQIMRSLSGLGARTPLLRRRALSRRNCAGGSTDCSWHSCSCVVPPNSGVKPAKWYSQRRRDYCALSARGVMAYSQEPSQRGKKPIDLAL